MAGMIGRVARGVVAGVAGTLAMDLLWWSRHRRSGGEDSFTEWDISSGSTASFEEASAPGQVGPRAGLLTGAGAFANSYATLGAIGVYEPIWEYDTETLAQDLSGPPAVRGNHRPDLRRAGQSLELTSRVPSGTPSGLGVLPHGRPSTRTPPCARPCLP